MASQQAARSLLLLGGRRSPPLRRASRNIRGPPLSFRRTGAERTLVASAAAAPPNLPSAPARRGPSSSGGVVARPPTRGAFDDDRRSRRWHARPLSSAPRGAAFSTGAAEDAKADDGDRKSSEDAPPEMAEAEAEAEGAEGGDGEPEAGHHAEVVNRETLEFQAETRQLLDIVTHSLYTDKEVFLRELISNASDALEKLRHVRAANEAEVTVDPDVDLEIRIETDEMNGTLTITDTGIGLTREDMVSNLGTIARSGSKAFVKELAESSSAGAVGALDASRGIIGKFGVGFYSAFMVGDKVEVRSKSAYKSDEASPALVWSSTGAGGYDIGDLPSDVRQGRGASVVIHLGEDHVEFSDEKRVESVLKKYSNFVNFPIYLNGNRVNTMEAVWAHDPSTVTDETYTAFYKFIAHAYDEPLDRLHYRADAPLEIKALFYIPSFHSEKYGMGRMEPGVSLYSRKVLIESKSPDILPEWMRFVKGVVDSEDLPLAISREKPQDTALIGKLRKALTRKFISHLTTMARKKTDKYKDEFYKEYSYFLKEGICQDYEFQGQMSKLLYFETSKAMAGELVSLDEYVSRCPPEQKEIYYLCAPTRDLALESPYLEAFERAGREVIFVFTAIDDFVMSNLEKFEGRALVTAEKSDIDLGDATKDEDDAEKGKDDDGKEGEAAATTVPSKLDEKEAAAFCAWAKATLGPKKVTTVRTTTRLGSSPAIVTNNESGAMRRMMRLVDTQDGGTIEGMPLGAQQLEINPRHPLVVGVDGMRRGDPKLAEVCVAQIFDNALVAAGLLDDGRSMLPRLNDLLLCVVRGAAGKGGEDGEGDVAAPPEKEEEEEKPAAAVDESGRWDDEGKEPEPEPTGEAEEKKGA